MMFLNRVAKQDRIVQRRAGEQQRDDNARQGEGEAKLLAPAHLG
jgi:hypothetical protein